MKPKGSLAASTARIQLAVSSFSANVKTSSDALARFLQGNKMLETC
jgi:hypothetical protein